MNGFTSAKTTRHPKSEQRNRRSHWRGGCCRESTTREAQHLGDQASSHHIVSWAALERLLTARTGSVSPPDISYVGVWFEFDWRYGYFVRGCIRGPTLNLEGSSRRNWDENLLDGGCFSRKVQDSLTLNRFCLANHMPQAEKHACVARLVIYR